MGLLLSKAGCVYSYFIIDMLLLFIRRYSSLDYLVTTNYRLFTFPLFRRDTMTSHFPDTTTVTYQPEHSHSVFPAYSFRSTYHRGHV
jgi:hypothetical protein